ncbi:MAG TPA: AAA family ATPase [Gaiellaceae bacterium]|jgi:cell division protease FtsH|nr:AAA family ATPase [Gaiellaceae bacterium]
MATAAEPTKTVMLRSSEESVALAAQLRKLARVATFVAVLTSPAAYFWFRHNTHLGVGGSIAATVGVVIGFRGLVDLVIRRLIPWPSLFGTEETRLREEDVVNRRRAWTWRFWYRLGIWVTGIITLLWLKGVLFSSTHRSWWGTATHDLSVAGRLVHSGAFWIQIVVVFFLFFANFLIFMGPLMLMGISQIRGYEPGDAEWGVKLDDVRGQAEAKEEVRRVVTLWQSGEAFERAGGKRERGLLFLGAPGTGKTMLAKAIATGFNSPFVSIPGSGFAQTFIGIDALIVRFLARKAKKLARKWGGQCIVFIDEIDAVGMRRQALSGGNTFQPLDTVEPVFYGQFGALNSSGDLIGENAAWREHMFNLRAPERRSPYPGWMHKVGNIVNQGIFPGMMGGQGQLALNQLLVTMDGIDNPPFLRRFFTSRMNTLLDAVYIVPRRLGKVSLRLPPPRPLGAQIYFIGATNVPFERLDPALTRPGRMGRHVWFRTPTKEDRKDIFDLYLDRVSHDEELDTEQRRDEIARITNGYSPAMIEQICSMALTNAHHEGLLAFSWQHLVDAMTSVESGTAIGVQYTPKESRSVAIHEAGHASTAHAYRPEIESSRLSIKMRGGSLGHHQFFDREERFSSWQSEEAGDLIHTVGAMAAEHVFYGQNSNGVGGDLGMATQRAAVMVGIWGMAPGPVDLTHTSFEGDEQDEQDRIKERFETIGMRLMNRTRGSADFQGDPIASVLREPFKVKIAAQFLGQAFVIAYVFVQHNKAAVEKVANAVLEKKEIFGDDLNRLLDSVELKRPEIDWTKEETWPRI